MKSVQFHWVQQWPQKGGWLLPVDITPSHKEALNISWLQYMSLLGSLNHPEETCICTTGSWTHSLKDSVHFIRTNRVTDNCENCTTGASIWHEQLEYHSEWIWVILSDRCQNSPHSSPVNLPLSPIYLEWPDHLKQLKTYFWQKSNFSALVV